MKGIKNVIELIIAGEVTNPFTVNGVRVTWDEKASTLTITSLNKAPDDDMPYFYSCIKTAGFKVLKDEIFDESPDQPNSQVGYKLKLMKAKEPPPQVEQFVIFQ